jgi:hypothetical protein
LKLSLLLGYGIRFSSYSASGKYFETAPANLIKENKLGDFYTDAQINSLNLAFYAEYKIFKKIDLGFNIDVFGGSFGKQQQGIFIFQPLGTLANAKPTSLNVLLTGNNSKGTLNSEFFLRYWFNEKLALKGGFSYFFAEYTTTQKLAFDNNRFRNKAPMGFVGITYKLF